MKQIEVQTYSWLTMINKDFYTRDQIKSIKSDATVSGAFISDRSNGQHILDIFFLNQEEGQCFSQKIPEPNKKKSTAITTAG